MMESSSHCSGNSKGIEKFLNYQVSEKKLNFLLFQERFLEEEHRRRLFSC